LIEEQQLHGTYQPAIATEEIGKALTQTKNSLSFFGGELASNLITQQKE
jgi:hypothetical protein